ncbi:hypothetical protein Tco_0559697, partial [Tanacetum coccineum]
MFDELLTPPPNVDYPVSKFVAIIHEVVAPVPTVSTGSPSSTNVDQDAAITNHLKQQPETQRSPSFLTMLKKTIMIFRGSRTPTTQSIVNTSNGSSNLKLDELGGTPDDCDEVLKLKNFKKDALLNLFKLSKQERCFKIIGYPVDFGKKKPGQNVKGKNISNNNSVGSSLSSGFTDEQLATLISLIKDNSVGKNVQANMAVGHPNGIKAFISTIGNLRLPNGLVLFDVLVVPEYSVAFISVHKLAIDNKIFVAFDGSRCYFLNLDLNLKNVMGIDSVSKKVDTLNVFQDLNHINFFHNEFPEMPNDDERVNLSLNSDHRSQSDSSHSSVPSGGVDTTDLLSNNSRNDADSSDDIFATQDEQVTTLEDNVFSEGDLDQNPSTSTQGTQTVT